jgi:hypothetical protein
MIHILGPAPNTKSVEIHILGPTLNTKSVGINTLGPIPNTMCENTYFRPRPHYKKFRNTHEAPPPIQSV